MKMFGGTSSGCRLIVEKDYRCRHSGDLGLMSRNGLKCVMCGETTFKPRFRGRGSEFYCFACGWLGFEWLALPDDAKDSIRAYYSRQWHYERVVQLRLL